MKKDVSIAVIGAGAIGGITAAFLKKAGFDVEIVCKYRKKAKQVINEGLHITGVRGEQTVKMKAVADIEELSGKKDVVLIATKAYDMPDAAVRALPFLKASSMAVSMQNGICVEALAAVVGEKRTVGCVVGWGSTMLTDGTLNMTSEGEFVIGGLLPGKDAGDLKEILEAVVPVRISDNIVSDLYSKMIINSCITSTGRVERIVPRGDTQKKNGAEHFHIHHQRSRGRCGRDGTDRQTVRRQAGLLRARKGRRGPGGRKTAPDHPDHGI